MGRLSWTTRLYLAGIVVLAGAAIFVSAPRAASPWQWWGIYAILAFLFLICDSTPVSLSAGRSAWSPSSAATLAAVVLLGAAGAALVGAVAIVSIRRGMRVAERLFNGAMYAIAGYAAGITYLVVATRASLPVPDLLAALSVPAPRIPAGAMFWMLLRPFAAAAVVHVVVNHSILHGMLWADRRGRAGRARRRPADDGAGGSWQPLLLASDLGFAALGLVIAALWAVVGPFAAAIVLVPLYVARWAMAQFAEHQQAHVATLAALCQAVETKDFYTRGHSDRVSKGSNMLAREIGMRGDRVAAVTSAGMLHDVGKLGVPTMVLQKVGPLTDEEYAALQLHPMRGLEIVSDIGFLDEALTGIMHHHERIDGKGYPMGLVGAEIPEFARVIAVADAFDSMTSNRAYRRARTVEEGLAELRNCAGSQFDPRMVDAFAKAVHREGWKVATFARPRGDENITAHDHDDPTTPLRRLEDP
jgi:hypothetical protein